MAMELQQVLYALILALAHFVIYAVVANRELGTDYTAGPRDAPPPPMSKVCGRIGRAYANYLETLPWFMAAMIVAHLAGKVDWVVIACGWTYLVARVVYFPVYVSGIPWVRSIVWAIALTAIFVIVLRALL